jgi:DNA-binding NarL/FixJ family response regulator
MSCEARRGASCGSTEEMVRPAMRVLIADDRPRSRQGLRALLATQSGIDVVAEARDGLEALRLVEESRPDTVVMDARMPAMDGLTATRAIKERWPEVRVVVLTMYGSHRADALASGADAFLVKGCPAEDLLEAILEREGGNDERGRVVESRGSERPEHR